LRLATLYILFTSLVLFFKNEKIYSFKIEQNWKKWYNMLHTKWDSINKFQVSDSILSSHICVRNTRFYNLSLSYKLYWMRETMTTPWNLGLSAKIYCKDVEFFCVRNVSKIMWSHSMISSISQKAHYKKLLTIDDPWSTILDPWKRFTFGKCIAGEIW